MAHKSRSKSGTSLEKREKMFTETPKCPKLETEQEQQEESFLRVKFQKLVVSSNNLRTSQKKTREPVLKSEIQAIQLSEKSKNSAGKTILRKSKLGESFKKFRTPADLNSAIQDSKDVTTSENEKIFGRKFSLSLENFGNLSLLDNSNSEQSKDSTEFTTESFKKLNVSSFS